jgi:hypothetical protein
VQDQPGDPFHEEHKLFPAVGLRRQVLGGLRGPVLVRRVVSSLRTPYLVSQTDARPRPSKLAARRRIGAARPAPAPARHPSLGGSAAERGPPRTGTRTSRASAAADTAVSTRCPTMTVPTSPMHSSTVAAPGHGALLMRRTLRWAAIVPAPSSRYRAETALRAGTDPAPALPALSASMDPEAVYPGSSTRATSSTLHEGSIPGHGCVLARARVDASVWVAGR